MKILWITEFFPKTDAGEITGGVEARCFFVSQYLRQKGVTIKILARSTGGQIWHPPVWQSLWDRVTFTVRAFYSGLRENFDLVEGTNSSTYLLALLLSLIKNKPVVYWFPDVFYGQWIKIAGLVGILGDISDWIIFHFPKGHYIAISETTRNKLMVRGIAKNKIRVIYCGYDTGEVDMVSNLKRKICFDVVSVSRLLNYKRIGDLRLAVETQNLKSVVIGQGPEKKNLQNIRGLKLMDFVPSHREVLKTIYSGRVFCHPSTIEGFGIVIIEAMALGVPVVAANIPVVQEITKNGQGALLFKPGEPIDLAEKLKLLLNDKKLYQKKSLEAKLIAKSYTWEITAEQTKQFYEDMHVN